MAVIGHNGYNETFVGMSNSVGLTFFDENNNQIEIINSNSPIEIEIQRDINLPSFPYQYVNISQILLKYGSFFMSNGFNLTSNNASIHIELKPLNESIGYLFALKLGYSPIINSTFADYDSFKIMCPSKLII